MDLSQPCIAHVPFLPRLYCQCGYNQRAVIITGITVYICTYIYVSISAYLLLYLRYLRGHDQITV